MKSCLWIGVLFLAGCATVPPPAPAPRQPSIDEWGAALLKEPMPQDYSALVLECGRLGSQIAQSQPIPFYPTGDMLQDTYFARGNQRAAMIVSYLQTRAAEIKCNQI